MRKVHRLHSKVFYRPIEAAIRWSGLVRFESQILNTLGDKAVPEPASFPRWPELCLNTQRIFDALAHGELAYGKDGITRNDPTLLTDPGLTIRHVDLKAWVSRFYPDQRPAFLFDAFERYLHPAISVDAMHALLMDREALKLQLANRTEAWDTLHAQFLKLSQEHEAQAARERQNGQPGSRSEATYLNIVGGMLTLLLGRSPSGVPYSSFETLDAVISTLIAHHGDRSGISERTLAAKFAAARRHLAAHSA